MDYLVRNKDIHLFQDNFDLDETLDCGQAFRWEKASDGKYYGAKMNFPLTVYKEKDYFVLENTREEDFLNVWYDYFDLATDYGELKRIYSEDETLCKACGYASGIRLLRQDPWESLVSFIISQNNNIPRIKGIISRLCGLYGGFPEPSDMRGTAPEELEPLRAGFRSKYLCDAAEKVNFGEIDLDKIKGLSPEEGRAALTAIKGVGPKVADCTMLYGMYKTDCFPTDVWIKRVLAEYYPNGFPDLPSRGIAQQYLFHYMRTKQDKE